MIYKKKGAPIIEVIAPTGKALPLPISLEIVSANSNNILPIKIEAGIVYLWLAPIILLAIWGHIIPTKPIIPKKETQEAVINDEINNDKNLNSLTLTPKEIAWLSPHKIALYLQEEI